MNRKPLGRKSYGHIAHLPGSRMGPGDHHCDPGQARIATEKARDRHDVIIVQEKVDGSNVGIAKIRNDVVPLTRAGYRAETSPFEQHHFFADWVLQPANWERFNALLEEGERVCGEWLMLAHGTRYDLPHEPLVISDLMRGTMRIPFPELQKRAAAYGFVVPNTVHEGKPFSVVEAMERLKVSGHGATDPVEGAVWRVERNALVDPGRGGERYRKVDFLVKYVRPDKQDGIFLPEISGQTPIWNWYPKE